MAIYDELDQIEADLPDLLSEPDMWKAEHVGRPHRAERLFRQVGQVGVHLHNFYNHEDNVVWHPHPWPMAARVLSGSYEMSIGYGTDEDAEKVSEVCSFVVSAGQRYKMEHRYGWHKIDLLEVAVRSVMITLPLYLPSPMVYGKLGLMRHMQIDPLPVEKRNVFISQHLELL